MKTDEGKALVPQQTGALAIIGKQIQLTNKILNAHRLAIVAEEFHVPRDGSLYDAVERVRPGGTIRIAAGEYRIDRVIHINKPLSIIGDGREKAVLVSDLEEHYLNIEHDGYFALKQVMLKSECRFYGGMLAVDCRDVSIEQCDFIGINDFIDSEELDFEMASKRYVEKGNAVKIKGKTSGNLLCNRIANNLYGIRLQGTTTIRITKNTIENNFYDGISYTDSATGTAEGNICSRNGTSGICVSSFIALRDEFPILLNNTCEENMTGIKINTSATGIAEGNVCRGNKSYGISTSNGAINLLNNICENNKCGIGFVGSGRCDAETNEIWFFGEVAGTAEGNICSGNIETGICVSHNASPSILRNTCEENKWGIAFVDFATGTVEENTCRRNTETGICVSSRVASLNLLRNMCEKNKNGIVHSGQGTIEGNICRENIKYGICANSFFESLNLFSNVCEDNEIGIVLDLRCGSIVKDNSCRRNKMSGMLMFPSLYCPDLIHNLIEFNTKYGIHYLELKLNNNGHIMTSKSSDADLNVYRDNKKENVFVEVFSSSRSYDYKRKYFHSLLYPADSIDISD